MDDPVHITSLREHPRRAVIRRGWTVTKLRRSKQNVEDLGKTCEVKWKTGETPMLIILTTKSNLLIYDLTPLTPSSSTVYSLPPNLSNSFLLTGPAERVPFPKLVLRYLGEFLRRTEDEHISCVDSPKSPFRHATDQQSYQSQPSSTSYLGNLDWLVNRSVTVVSITYSGPLSLYIFVTSDGRAYLVHRVHSPPTPGCIAVEPIHWVGRCFHSLNKDHSQFDSSLHSTPPNLDDTHTLNLPKQATDNKGIDSPATGACAINVRFSLVALALDRGVVAVYALGYFTSSTTYSHTLNLATSLNNLCRSDTGPVNMCSWTSDGHALAVSWSNGFSVWSVFGRLQAWGNGLPTDEEGDTVRDNKWQDVFMGSGTSLFWGPGNFELFLLTKPHSGTTKWTCDEQLFVLPFAKSAVTTLHSPDNTKHAFLQLDDRVLAYRGADSPDMSVINPESDVWQHIKIPSDYISTNWPIEMSCISDDGKLVAVAGRKGLTHFNSVSGRWKLFEREEEEQAFCVSGGMQWIGNVLVFGCNEGGLYSIRLFSRDNPLSMSYCLCDHALPAPIVLLSIYDTSLLVYTGDNTLHHFLIAGGSLTPCGSIGFEGVVGTPSRSIHLVETSEQKGSERVLPLVVEFLDHFQEALQVVVGCARKTDVKQWGYLFSVVGKPRNLFEKSLEQGLLKIAASYLLVLHNLDPLEQSSRDTIRLYKAAMAAKDWALCKELLRFLFSLDRTGLIMKTALDESKSGKEDLLMKTPPSLIDGSSKLVNAIDGIDLEDNGMGFASPPRPTHLHGYYPSVDQKKV
ncbi:uncharacterized protein MELLADRAFT_107549 [Melampsora larici-populina 98AG31]|uniref:Uncharacterized protein n=1 Tax=Melampsora larici-populina (strain 98AG31 / pathotype 3-4-7) TaxID=747676 RepID=F4RQM5_MELLP|nr:uncharacterized protein MELLADRAFT_107549 [Melampsora larici-populina 98AG31]EGG05324.1 hypothetical protein MELLADRAFT_107549 [Melampsora larici-populina 98AG31]